MKNIQEQFKMVKDIDRVRNDERKGGRSQCNVITSADAPLSRGLAKQGAWLGVNKQSLAARRNHHLGVQMTICNHKPGAWSDELQNMKIKSQN